METEYTGSIQFEQSNRENMMKWRLELDKHDYDTLSV